MDDVVINDTLGIKITFHDGGHTVETTRPSFESILMSEDSILWVEKVLSSRSGDCGPFTGA